MKSAINKNPQIQKTSKTTDNHARVSPTTVLGGHGLLRRLLLRGGGGVGGRGDDLRLAAGGIGRLLGGDGGILGGALGLGLGLGELGLVEQVVDLAVEHSQLGLDVLGQQHRPLRRRALLLRRHRLVPPRLPSPRWRKMSIIIIIIIIIIVIINHEVAI